MLLNIETLFAFSLIFWGAPRPSVPGGKGGFAPPLPSRPPQPRAAKKKQKSINLINKLVKNDQMNKTNFDFVNLNLGLMFFL